MSSLGCIEPPNKGMHTDTKSLMAFGGSGDAQRYYKKVPHLVVATPVDSHHVAEEFLHQPSVRFDGKKEKN